MAETIGTGRQCRPTIWSGRRLNARFVHVPGAIQSIERAAAILQLIAESPAPVGLTQVAEALDLAKATTNGLLKTLQDVGFLDHDPDTGKYQLGRALIEMGGAQIDPNDLRSHAMNWADSLASRSGESVRMAAFVAGEPTIVHHVFRPDDTLQQFEVGGHVPIHATALGKALLAWSGFPGRRMDGELDRYTQHTITSSRDLNRALVDVRRLGWAADIEEYHPGEASVAAPLRGRIGRVVGAIGIVGPAERVCDTAGHPRAHLVKQVCEAARSVSRDLVTSRR